MADEPTVSVDREQRLDQVVTDYLKALRAGQAGEPREWLERYPDLAAELSDFFADRAYMDRVAEPLRDSVPAVGTRARYFGDYELLEEIARGGMGVIFKARQVSLNRVVALKMILHDQPPSAAERQRFQAEAEAVANLDHPNILPLHEVGEHEGQQYFSMKLVADGNLAQHLPGFLDAPRTAAQLVATVARAVHYAHQRGILHRDLKPANILLEIGTDASAGRTPIPYVVDFGLAKRVSGTGSSSGRNLTRSGTIVGTPGYMAPEQARAEKGLTVAADVYSLGAILYELLTGALPFRAANALDVLLQVLEKEPARPRSLRPGVDRDLETICLKCLEKDPARRYPSAEALAEDLERWLAGRSISARPAGRAEQLWRWCRRNQALAVASAAAIVALLATAAISVTFAIHQKQAAANLQQALEESERNRRQSAEYAFRLAYQKALEQHKDKEEEAMLGLTRALELAPEGSEDLQAECREKLTEWGQELGPRKPPLEHDDRVNQVAFSPDGRTILTSSSDHTARLWDAATRRQLFILRGHTAEVHAAVFSPDGKTILTGSADRTAKLWDTATGKLLHTLEGHPGAVIQAVFSPDGATVATVSGFSFLGLPAEARLWDTATGRACGGPLHHQSTLATLAFSADGRMLWTWGKDRVVRGWDARTGHSAGKERPFPEVPDWRTGVAFSPDGRLVLASGKTATRLWDLASGEPAGPPISEEGVIAVGFLRQGEVFITVGGPSGLAAWETATGRKLDRCPPRRQDLWYFDHTGRQLMQLLPDGGEAVYDSQLVEGGEQQVMEGLGTWSVLPGAFDPRSTRDLEVGLIRQGFEGHRVQFTERQRLTGTPGQLRLWAEVVTRMALDDTEKPRRLDEPSWQERRQHLAEEVAAGGLPDFVAVAARDPLFWVRQEATKAESQGAWPRARSYLNRLIEAEPTVDHLDRRGQVHAAMEKYDLAAQDFTAARRQARAVWWRDGQVWYRAGLVYLAARDRAGYGEACTALLQLAEKKPRLWDTTPAVNLSSLSAEPAWELARLAGRLAKEAADRPLEGQRWLQLATIQYRFGRVAPQVLERAEAAARTTEAPRGWLFLAMIHHKAGRSAEAREWLNKAIRWLEVAPAEAEKRDWWTTLEVRLLRQEAEAVLAQPKR
jgi:WD40 repeat protein/tRNA A-37 threonylcarbamoyl transferase component Bud32